MGPYNNIKNWDYAGLIQVFNAEDGHGRGVSARNGRELAEAIKVALANREGPTLIELRSGLAAVRDLLLPPVLCALRSGRDAARADGGVGRQLSRRDDLGVLRRLCPDGAGRRIAARPLRPPSDHSPWN